MSSITESTARAKTSDELKREFDAALSEVDRDLTELKKDLTPEHIISEVIHQEHFDQMRSAYNYLRERPFLVIGAGLAIGVLISMTGSAKRVYN